jgi:hypothetical protein
MGDSVLYNFTEKICNGVESIKVRLGRHGPYRGAIGN